MNSPKTIGITVAVLGLLLTCCSCPLALNSLIAFANPRSNFYYQLFPAQAAQITLLQLVCISLMAVVVLVLGAIVLIRGRSAQ